MHSSRSRRRTAATVRWLIAAGSAAALGGMALPGTAQATPRTGAPVRTAAPDQQKHSVTPLCAEPRSSGVARCFALRRNDGAAKAIAPNATPSGYGPADLHSAYNLPANGGAGQTVAIVDAFDDPNAAADLAVYREQYGLPALTDGQFRKVDQRGGTDYPTPDADWSGEISLDLDMVSATAPAADILLVEADSAEFSDLGAAVDKAVDLGAKYVSNSYGSGYTSTPGSGEDPSETTDMDPFYNHPGVAMVASSGDDAYGVSYPAASQYVTSVGGTSLAKDSSSRGWTESVWNNSYGGPGSGCSLYEPKPAFQKDTGCDQRAVTDVSAVADPATGVAVYDSYQTSDPWAQYGGTSASSPIIAATYADAGTPATGSYPNSYPYANPAALNDVTTGNNGTCTPAYLCTAAAGYDGPTGLGTPNGLAAFTSGPHGQVSGAITGAGKALTGAKVSAGDASATTDTDGKYELSVPAGTYTVTISAYGYATKTVKNVVVADGKTVTENADLASVPSHTVAGAITDGSGHGWPLYATVTADGVPGGPVYTDPATGRYSLDLAEGATYTLHVTANYPGYQAVDTTVAVKKADLTKNIKVAIDTTSTEAPGYSVTFDGPTQPFDASTAPAGWTVQNDNADGGGWVFDDAGSRGNLTGGTGGFAIVDSDNLGEGKTQDTYLVSQTYDLSKATAPELQFDTDYNAFDTSTADAEVSVNGKTWTTVWTASGSTNGHIDVPLPQAAGKATVSVRFHYTGNWAEWWELDNVFVGNRAYTPVHGGLVVGTATDANTGSGLNGVAVTSADKPAEHGTSYASGSGDGFYWLFSSLTGNHGFAAAKAHYTGASKTVNVATNYATRADFTLTAGQLSVTPGSLAKTVPWGGTASGTVTVKNTGGQPATVTVGEQPGSVVPLAQRGAATHRLSAKTSKLAMLKAKGSKTAAPKDVAPAEDPWQTVADLPVTVQDNAVAADGGKVYSAFGYTGTADTADLYAYDPDSGSWSKLASAADTRESPAHGFLGGKLYAAGGWGADGNPDPKLEIYDPGSDSWSTGTATPKPYAGSGSATLGGKLYVVGGCTADACGNTDVTAYDPGSDSWSSLAAYPEPIAWESCGGIAGKLYCSGGTTDAGSVKHSYVYDPAADAWTQIADMPADLWGSAYAAANGELVVSGGAVNAGAAITNEGYAYDPGTDAWTALPGANASLYRMGGALGFYAVGGNPGGFGAPPLATAETLPGYDQGDNTDVTWVSEDPTQLTLAPGKSAKITVSLNADVPEITQPGTFNASLVLATDTPYSVPPVAVALTVKPPASWGKVTGTVTDGTAPIPGATVEIDSWASSYTLKTDKNGGYALWLDVRNNPLQMIVAKDGFKPQVKTVKVVKGKTVTTNFVLQKP